ncbi:MAG: hypothetical protein IPJ82_11630 [Lewinellaceae bacterium]|nr:hypothetical protein [Lewinellaceae bacterium]
MSAENGLGRVEQKNVFVEKDTFCDLLASVRHGNGRDWWIAAPKPGSGHKASDKIMLFRFSPQGIEGPFIKTTGLKWKGNPTTFTVGQAVFPPTVPAMHVSTAKTASRSFVSIGAAGSFPAPCN